MLRVTGPFLPFDPASLRPLTAPRNFVATVADALYPLEGAHAAIDSSAGELTDNVPGDFDAALGMPIQESADVLQNEIGAAPASPAPILVDTGDNSETLRQSVSSVLPPVDTPLTSNFEPPPAAPPAGPPARKDETDHTTTDQVG